MNDLQVMAEPHRQRILRLVWDQELAAGEIAQQFDVTFGAVSQHLRVLREAGMVSVRRDGNRRLYRVDQDRLAPWRPVLEDIWSSALDRLADAVESDPDG